MEALAWVVLGATVVLAPLMWTEPARNDLAVVVGGPAATISLVGRSLRKTDPSSRASRPVAHHPTYLGVPLLAHLS